MSCIIEACIETYDEAVQAEQEGATRIELCERLDLGGTTPNLDLTKEVLKGVNIPIRVMIRPRGGNFVYNSKEFYQMKEDIKTFEELPIEGFVFGILTNDNKVDFERMSELIELAKPAKVTFHKAIDEVVDIIDASKKLIELGVDNILSSGGFPTALEGRIILNKMIEATNNKIIVAGKVTSENLDEVKRLIPSLSYHGRRIVNSTKN